MISGLLASTALTLLVTPACYLLLLHHEAQGSGSDPAEGGNYGGTAAVGAP